jgi:hypothetical protein
LIIFKTERSDDGAEYALCFIVDCGSRIGFVCDLGEILNGPNDKQWLKPAASLPPTVLGSHIFFHQRKGTVR